MLECIYSEHTIKHIFSCHWRRIFGNLLNFRQFLSDFLYNFYNVVALYAPSQFIPDPYFPVLCDVTAFNNPTIAGFAFICINDI